MSTIKSSAENLTLNADGANNDIKFQSNGSEVASIDQAGVLVSTGGSTHADNVKAKFGTGNDLEMYHDGSASYIKDVGTGNLLLSSDGAAVILQTSQGEKCVEAVKDGTVNLYHNNSKKFETTATGVAVTGGVAIGGTGAANTLSDYEEGTWTPACGVATVSSIGRAFYTKIGRLVHVFAYIQLAADGSGSNISFTGLPFTVDNEVYEVGIAQFSKNSTSRGIMARTSGNSTTIDFLYTDGDQAQLPASTVDGGHVMISLTYNID